jgi:HK97 family phage major capsid protein
VSSNSNVPISRRYSSKPSFGDESLGERIRSAAHVPASRETYRKMAASADAQGARIVQLETENAGLRTASLTVSEPATYSRHSPNSFFADLFKVESGLGDVTGARARLVRHEDECAAFYPAWRAQRAAAAAKAYEDTFASTRRGQILLERMDKLGLEKFLTRDAFEQRAINRTDGTGGYFSPPLWVLEDWAMAPRAGRPFADLWTSLPLRPGTDSINVPHWSVGLATGPQSADGASTSTSSATDSYANSTVQTISGYQDISQQWGEQAAPPGADVFVFKDLMNDAAGSLDAQLLIGSGTSGTLKGIIVAGAASVANLVTITNAQNVSGSTITVATAHTPVYVSVARMLKIMNKSRGLPATHIVMNPATWWDLAGMIDTTGKPVLPLTACAPEPGPDGAAGTAWGRSVILDDQLPLTFGGAGAPTVATSGAVTAATAGNGSYAVIAAVRAPDLYLFEGEIRTRVLRDVTSGTAQWRFQVLQYAAALRDRYTAGSTISISTGDDTGGINSGGTPSAGVTTNYQANSPLASE